MSPAGAAALEPFFACLRWGAVVLGFTLALVDHDQRHVLVAAAALVVYTVGRTIWPIGFDRAGSHPAGALLVEVAIGVTVVEASGFGRSPLLVSLAVAAAVAGFAGGVRVVVGMAGVAGLAVVVPSLFLPTRYPGTSSVTKVAIELVLLGVVGGLGRYLVEDALGSRVGLDARVRHLAEVNDLLLDLHAAALREPTPLDLDGAARWAVARLAERFAPDDAAMALRDPVTGDWRLVTDATAAPGSAQWAFELPAAMAAAGEGNGPMVSRDLEHGLSYRSRWGLYCPLRARGELIGVLAVESPRQRDTRPEDLRCLEDLARVVALAVDNARWLERIHTLGVEEERTRLARELHDHVGQSVVYLGLEVDRLIAANDGRGVQHDLVTLRADLRELVRELRDALVDLRSDVSEAHGVDDVLATFVDRVNARGAVKVTLVTDASARMPLSVEREFSRVAREAVANAERHARASKISVLWRCREDEALLEIADDGVGMSGTATRASAFGLVGMRERADSVRAKLEISSRRGEGTVIRMRKAVS